MMYLSSATMLVARKALPCGPRSTAMRARSPGSMSVMDLPALAHLPQAA